MASHGVYYHQQLLVYIFTIIELLNLLWDLYTSMALVLKMFLLYHGVEEAFFLKMNDLQKFEFSVI